MNFNKYKEIVFSLTTGILPLFGLFLALCVPPVQANAGILYVSSTDPTCGGQSPCYTTIQNAVDAASGGDVIKVAAGIYTGVQTRDHTTQVVYLSKNLTIQGGYTTVDWNTSDPDASPVTLDAQGLGRGLVISDTITTTVEGLHITGGDATGLGGGSPLGSDAGGAVYVYTATATISNCVIYSNTASTTASGYGGGLYLTYGTATLSGNTIISNTASTVGSGRGGGVYLAYSNATLNGNRMQGNLAGSSGQGDGGGLYSWSSTSTLSSNIVRGNTACTDYVGSGGGLFFWHSTTTLTDNTVQGNIATVSPYGSSGKLHRRAGEVVSCGEIDIVGSGGGLSFIGSTATLSNNVVISNTATNSVGGSGGGLSFSSSSGILSGNRIQGNTASTGSGAYSGGRGGGLDFYGNSTATLNGNLVRDNVASSASIGQGGGLCFWGNEATLSGNRVQGNTASSVDCGSGGGLLVGGSNLTLSDNMVISNTATMNLAAAGRGGGLRIWSRRSFTLTNNLVAGNHASTEGSGLSFEGESTDPTSGHLRHTTIANNNGGSGHGVFVGNYTTLTFTNTIIAGHDSVGITVTTGSTATLEATLWYDNGSPIGGGGCIFSGTINLNGDPAFVNPSAWDYHLTPSSAAIDKGVSAGVTQDFDSDSRPVDGDGDGTAVVDIGADEFAWKHIYLPLVVMRFVSVQSKPELAGCPPVAGRETGLSLLEFFSSKGDAKTGVVLRGLPLSQERKPPAR